MIKIEKTFNSLECDVICEGKKIGHMRGVNIIQWFLKNKYYFRGTFSKFNAEKLDHGILESIFDIILLDKKLVIKGAQIEWMKNPFEYGTFQASGIDTY
jgi:hypothetical protein